MDKDVDALETIECLPDDRIRAGGGCDICLDKMRVIALHGFRPGRHDDGSSPLQGTDRNRLTRAPGATCHQNTFAVEFSPRAGKRITIGHERLPLESPYAPTDMSVENAISFRASRAARRSVRHLCMIV